MLTVIILFVIYSGYSQINTTGQTALDSIANKVIHYLQAKQADSILYFGLTTFTSQLSKEAV